MNSEHYQKIRNGLFHLIDLLQMKFAAAPFFGSDIGDGFREVPAVTVKILSIVLALAVGVVLWLSEDDGAVLPCALAMTLGIFDANLNDMRPIRHGIAFGNGEAALAGLHLDAVIGDAESDRKPERLGQPIGGCTGVRIDKHRDNDAWRYGSVKAHLENSIT